MLVTTTKRPSFKPAGEFDLLSAFANFLRIDVAAGQASADTIKTYHSQVRHYLRWCVASQVNPGAANSAAIKEYRRWLSEAGYKVSTIRARLSVIKRFYDAALSAGLVGVNPAVGVKAPVERRDPAERITYLEREELQRLISAIGEDTVSQLRDKLIVSIMGVEGARTVELHRASVRDVVYQGCHRLGIRVEGKRSLRIIPLPKAIASLLQKYLEARKVSGEDLTPDTPLFICTAHRAFGARLSRRSFRRVVDKYLKQTELKHKPGRTISAHSLRHTAGTLALRAGAELRQVQDLLGHADPRTTALYTHVGDRWENNPGLLLDIDI